MSAVACVPADGRSAATTCVALSDAENGLEDTDESKAQGANGKANGLESRHCCAIMKVFRHTYSKTRRAISYMTDAATNPIPHRSEVKSAWDWFIVAVVLYTSVIVPFEAAFITSDSSRLASGGEYMHSLSLIDLTVCAIFAVDMVLSFRTTFTDERGVTECRPMPIARRYLNGWFFIDVLSLLPIEVVFLISQSDKTAYATGLLKAIRLPRLLRVAKKFKAVATNGTAVLSLLIGAFVLCCHWLGCMFYALAMAERPYLPEPKIGWIDNLAETMYLPINDSDPNSGPDIRHRYLASLDFSISCVTNIGLGNTSPNSNLEKIFSIFLMLVGSFLYTAVIRNVNSLAAAYGTHGAFRKQKKVLSEFSAFHCLPRVLKQRLERSFRKNWSLTRGHPMEEVLRGFPEHLVADVAIFINKEVWMQFSLFQGLDSSCLREIAVKMVTMRVGEGHYVLHRGEIVGGVYLIVRGNVTVKHKGTVLTTLGPWNAMCQVLNPQGSLTEIYSAYDVVADSYCDLRKIPVSAIEYFNRYYPDFSNRMERFLTTSFLLRHIASFRINATGGDADEIRRSLRSSGSGDALTENDADTRTSPVNNARTAVDSQAKGGHVVRTTALVHRLPDNDEADRRSEASSKETGKTKTSTSASCDALVGRREAAQHLGGCLECSKIGLHSRIEALAQRVNQVDCAITGSLEQLKRLILEDTV